MSKHATPKSLNPVPLSEEPDGLQALIQDSIQKDPGFADVWSPFAHMIALTDERIRLGLSQREIAERMGVAQPVVARMESDPSGVAFARILAYAKSVGAEISIKPSKAKSVKAASRGGRPVGKSRTVKDSTDHVAAA